MLNGTQQVIFLAIIIVCFVFVLINFIRLVVTESKNIIFPRIQVLSLRIAGLLPLFGVSFLLKFIFVKYDTFIDIGVAFFEAYCLYCFYKMQIFYVGSHGNIVQALRQSDHKFLCCNGFENKHPELFLLTGHMMLLQFVFVRPLFVLAQAVLELHDYGRASPIFSLFTALQLVSTVAGLLALLRFSFILSHHTRRLRAMQKLIFLKVLVLCIILENVAVNIIVSKTRSTEKQHQIVRIYSLVVLIELLLFSCFLQRVFVSDMRILLPEQDSQKASTTDPPADLETGADRNELNNNHSSRGNSRKDPLRLSINLTTMMDTAGTLTGPDSASQRHASEAVVLGPGSERSAMAGMVPPPRSSLSEARFLCMVANLFLYVFEAVDTAQTDPSADNITAAPRCCCCLGCCFHTSDSQPLPRDEVNGDAHPIAGLNGAADNMAETHKPIGATLPESARTDQYVSDKELVSPRNNDSDTRDNAGTNSNNLRNSANDIGSGRHINSNNVCTGDQAAELGDFDGSGDIPGSGEHAGASCTPQQLYHNSQRGHHFDTADKIVMKNLFRGAGAGGNASDTHSERQQQSRQSIDTAPAVGGTGAYASSFSSAATTNNTTTAALPHLTDAEDEVPSDALRSKPVPSAR